MQDLVKTKLSFISHILMQSAMYVFLVGSPDDEEEKAEGFIGEAGGGFFWFA